jgi:hypothetical protein
MSKWRRPGLFSHTQLVRTWHDRPPCSIPVLLAHGYATLAGTRRAPAVVCCRMLPHEPSAPPRHTFHAA